jgi:hypothetical protein
MKQPIARRIVTAQRTHMVQTVNEPLRQAWSREPLSIVTGEVELLIDVPALIEYLGKKALLSKGKRARGMSGDIEVRVLSRQEKKL